MPNETKLLNPDTKRSNSERVWEHRLLWFLVLAILGLWGYHYAISRVDNRLRREILDRIRQKFPGHVVQLERAHLEKGQFVSAEGLRISLRTADGLRDIVSIERLIAHGNIELLSLIKGQLPSIDRIQLDGVEASLWPTRENVWSLPSLSSTDAIPNNLPPIEVRRGMMRLGGASSDDREIVCHDLQATLQIIRPTRVPTESFLQIKASLKSSHFRRLSIEGTMAVDKSSWQAQGSIEDLRYSDSLVEQLPNCLTAPLQSIRGLSCQANASYEIKKTRVSEMDFRILGSVGNGTLQHPSLPYLLNNISGEIEFLRSGVQIRNVRASSDRSQLQLQATVNGYEATSSLQAEAIVENFELSPRFFQSLPSSIREQFAKFNLAGHINAQVRIDFDGQRWNPWIQVETQDVSLNADIFPYPLNSVRGKLEYRNGIITAPDLEALAGDSLVRGSLQLIRASPRWLFDLSLAAEDAIPINESLIAALRPRSETYSALENFVRQLQPGGKVHLVEGRFTRTSQQPHLVTKSLDLRFHKGQIQYSGFRYPIFGIEGQVKVDNELIQLNRLSGNNDGARISCSGQCLCADRTIADLQLEFKAETVPLEEELQRALPPEVRNLWDQVQPSGVLDDVHVTLRQQAGNPIDLRVSIHEDSKSDPQPAKSLSLQPVAIPYYLKDISCDIVYRPGSLQVLRLAGSHDASQVLAEGGARILPHGWFGSLQWLPTTRLIVDQSLLTSLPNELRDPLLSLDFRGPIHVTGWTQFASNATSGNPEARSWDVSLDIEDGRILGGGIASGIRGTVNLVGENLDRGPIAIGLLQLDSMSVRGIPVMDVAGKFSIESGKLLLGREANSTRLLSPQLASYSSDTARTQPTRTGEFATAQSASVQLASAHSAPAEILPAMNNDSRSFSMTPVPRFPPSQEVSDTKTVLRNSDSNDISASSLGGKLFLHGEQSLSTGRMIVDLQLRKANFSEFLVNLDQSVAKANGVLEADMQLQGSPLNINTLSGRGVVRIREADLYQLPQMVQLFRVLSVRPPDTGAFETADITYRVDGEQIWLDDIALDGDVISLKGKGTMNFRREMHLDLFTYVGRRGAIAKLIGPLIAPENSATLLQIMVDGTPDNPQMRRSLPFPSSMNHVFPANSNPRY